MAEQKKKTKLPKGRHQSQIKRQRQNEKRALQNLPIRSEVRTFIKKVRQALEKKDLAGAKTALMDATRIVDKAVSQGILHRNTGSRKISRLAHQLSTVAK